MSNNTLNLFKVEKYFARGGRSIKIMAYHGIPEEDQLKSFLKTHYFQVPSSKRMIMEKCGPRFGTHGYKVFLGPNKQNMGKVDITNLGNMLTDCADYVVAITPNMTSNTGKTLIYTGDLNGYLPINLQTKDKKDPTNLTISFHTVHAQYPSKGFEWISPEHPTESELEMLFKDAYREESHLVRAPEVEEGGNKRGYTGNFKSDHGSKRYDFHVNITTSDSIFTTAAGDWHPHLGRAYAFRTDTPIPIIASAADFHNQNKRQQRRA